MDYSKMFYGIETFHSDRYIHLIANLFKISSTKTRECPTRMINEASVGKDVHSEVQRFNFKIQVSLPYMDLSIWSN